MVIMDSSLHLGIASDQFLWVFLLGVAVLYVSTADEVTSVLGS